MNKDSFKKQNEKSVEIINESISIGKEIEETGKVKVHVTTEEIPYEEHINLKSTDYEIKRIKKNEFVDGPVDVIQNKDKTIIPVVEEVLVVEKKLKLVEEIHITKHCDVESSKITETLRKQKATIEK